MARQSQAWKDLERTAARKLRGTRYLRRWDLFERAVDVVAVDGFPEFRVDCKHYRRHAHHTLLDEIRRKYCDAPGAEPLLITKVAGEPGEVAVMDLDFLASLLDELRERRAHARGCPVRHVRGEGGPKTR